MDDTDKALLGIGVIVMLVLIAVAVILGTYLSGAYSYEYRCTEGVAEDRLHIWWGLPIGGFEPIDGDPIGMCERKEP